MSKVLGDDLEAKQSTFGCISRRKKLGNKLYVGNLPFTTTDADLEETFGAHGVVTSARVITDRETGRSRGFGFVEFENESDAATAQTALDGQDLGGRALRVNEAQEKQRRPSY